MKDIAQVSDYSAIGLDWCIEPSAVRGTFGPGIALQGNLDPDVLYGRGEMTARGAKRTRESPKDVDREPGHTS